MSETIMKQMRTNNSCERDRSHRCNSVTICFDWQCVSYFNQRINLQSSGLASILAELSIEWTNARWQLIQPQCTAQLFVFASFERVSLLVLPHGVRRLFNFQPESIFVLFMAFMTGRTTKNCTKSLFKSTKNCFCLRWIYDELTDEFSSMFWNPFNSQIMRSLTW